MLILCEIIVVLLSVFLKAIVLGHEWPAGGVTISALSFSQCFAVIWCTLSVAVSQVPP